MSRKSLLRGAISLLSKTKNKPKVSGSAVAGKGTGAARKTKAPGRRGGPTSKTSAPAKQKAPSRAPKTRDKRAAANKAAAKATVKKAAARKAARKAARGPTKKKAAKITPTTISKAKGKGTAAKKIAIASAVPAGVLTAAAIGEKKAKPTTRRGGPTRKAPAPKGAIRKAGTTPKAPVAMRGKGAPDTSAVTKPKPKGITTKPATKKKSTSLTPSQKNRLGGDRRKATRRQDKILARRSKLGAR
jgi:DnaK suppressor protein